MNNIARKPDGSLKMSKKGLYKQSQRLRSEHMKEKELKCWQCGSMPWRVEGLACKACGLAFAEEEVEIEIATLRSVAGNFEDNF